MTLDMAQAKRIAQDVEEKKLVSCVGFQDRYLHLIDRIKEELSDMQVGAVYGSWLGGVPQVWWWMKKDTCGGQLLEQNIHLVDLLRYFFGEAESVYACAGRGLICPSEFPASLPQYDTDDYSSALIRFKNGVLANLISGCFITAAGNGIRSGITIVGRDKSIEYELRSSVAIYRAKSTEKILWQFDQSVRHDRAFIDAVRANDPGAVRSPYADAYLSLALADAANRSMASGEVIKL
jgi:predicted dehydrogenase